jgi:hypothetical protein
VRAEIKFRKAADRMAACYGRFCTQAIDRKPKNLAQQISPG